MKVTFFTLRLMGGGAERVMVNLSRAFAGKGMNIDFVLSEANGPLLEQVSSKVRIVDLKIAPLRKIGFLKASSYLQSVRSILPLMRYLKRSKPDFLISEAHYSNEAAMLAKLLSGAPTKIVVAEQIMLSLHAKQGQHASARLATLTSRIFYRFADAIVASSHGVAKDSAQITGLPLERIKVIYNPSITPKLLNMSKEPVDHPWFAPGAPPVILSAGRLDSQKDFPTLIRAFARVRKARYARLVILGKGDEHHSLKTLIKELELEKDTALPGYLQNPFAYMSKAAVFVLSSIYEGLPNVLIEAMAAGTPVVSTDCPSGPAEILSNGKYGELIPVGDSEKMAAAIMRALDEKRKAIDPAWLGQFTVEVAAQKYIDLLMDCRKGVK